MSDYEIFAETVSNYRGGPTELTLRIAARDGQVVIGLSPKADGDARACLLEPAMAESVVAAIQEALAHLARKESNR